MVLIDKIASEFSQELSNLSLDPSALLLASIYFLSFILIILIGLYVYTSLAFYSIAKKAKHKKPGIAWIPFVGKNLIALQIAKMDWWPLLLILLFWIPFFSFIAFTVLFVFQIIWNWKMFEAIKRPGWWALFLIPFPLSYLVYLVLLGIVAWSKK